MTKHAENELVNVEAQLLDAKNMIANLTKMLEAQEHAMHSTCTAVSVALYVVIAVVTITVVVLLVGTVLYCWWKHRNPMPVNRCVCLKQ